MKNNRKILFITSEFWQGGAQRHLFEIDKVLSNIKYCKTILSLRDLQSDIRWSDYYYAKHIELGTEINFLSKINIILSPSFLDRLKKKILNKSFPNERQPIIDFLSQFDKILFIGEYTYPNIERWLSDELKSKSFICVVNSINQLPSNYDLYNKQLNYNFISGFQHDEINSEFHEFTNFNHHFFPLSISFSNEMSKWKPNKNKQKRIGIFTRLTKDKPIDIFIFALQLLRDKGLDVVLNIYGNGDPIELGFDVTIKNLSLSEHIIFKGHQSNLIETALNEKLDLIWFHGYHNFPGGFASFDLSSIAIPQVFWNFTPSSNLKKYEAFPMYTNMNQFVNYSFDILNEAEAASNLGIEQYNYINSNRNIKKTIGYLNSILDA